MQIRRIIYMNIGLKIKQLRRERNITQEELGELVGLTAKDRP